MPQASADQGGGSGGYPPPPCKIEIILKYIIKLPKYALSGKPPWKNFLDPHLHRSWQFYKFVVNKYVLTTIAKITGSFFSVSH